MQRGNVESLTIAGDEARVVLKENGATVLARHETDMPITETLAGLGVEPEQMAAVTIKYEAPGNTANWVSLGVNLLVRMTQKIAAALDADWDVEIVEAHHRMKVDAPSGTALMLGRAAAAGRGVSLEDAMVSGRDGVTGARNRGAIGFAAVRGGDIVGEHDVIFAADGERVILRHVATDRAIFARGALRAVLWGQGQKPGQYDMMDVLGL